MFAFRKPQQAYKLTAEELEQQKLDADENKGEQQRVSQLRDQSYLLSDASSLASRSKRAFASEI